jgi:hypothetical protein
VLAEGAAAPERSIEIDVDDVQPMFVGDLFGRRLAPRNAGIIDQDIDAAVAGRQLVGDLGDTARVRDIQDDDFGVQALGFQACTPGSGKLGSRSAITTFAPASARASAQASPIP